MAKVLIILMDGVGDCQTNEFKNKTCLEACNIPYMDKIAQSGLNGLMDPVETGLSCGSDTAHMNIFGYNPFIHYKGRGSFETMGSGLNMDVGEIAFKCNFAHMDEEQIVKKRRVDRGFEKWGLPLVEKIDKMKIKGFEDYYIRAKHATEHRCGVKICGGDQLSCSITGTDPLKDNLKLRKVQAKSQDKKAQFTAKLVNQLSDQINEFLEVQDINHKRKEDKQLTANIVLLRGCGERIDVDRFEDVHGLKGFMIAPTAIIKGLGQSIGLNTPDVEGATGDYHSNYINKAKAAIEQFKECDFGFIHIKAVDDAGHDKNGQKKVESIEKVDKMIEYIVKNKDFQDEVVVCITGDHTTPYILGDHTFEPVPVSVSRLSVLREMESGKSLQDIGNIYQDNVQGFDEKQVGQGILGRFPGGELMGILKKFRNKLQQ